MRFLPVGSAALLVLLDGVADQGAIEQELRGWQIPPAAAPDGPVVEIACRYDGADLAAVATAWGVSEPEVARLHTAADYRVAFCGFSPGFAYLTGLGDRFAVPRLPSPRTAVPAGSVGLAGSYTGVYPRSSPGGWQIIGRTDAVVWDPGQEPPALLTPGARVKFVDVG
jgi:KipI family sensor histidine kinase inhibitor